MGRAGDRGDGLGSRIIAARLVDIGLHLGFMLSRAWPPYSKWRGTMFVRLPGCSAIADGLARVLDARHWQDRQTALGEALTGLARLQGDAGLPVPPTVVEPFWDRPYTHLSRSLVPAVLATIHRPGVRALPVGVGGAEQQTDKVDALINPSLRRSLAASLHSSSVGQIP